MLLGLAAQQRDEPIDPLPLPRRERSGVFDQQGHRPAPLRPRPRLLPKAGGDPDEWETAGTHHHRLLLARGIGLAAYERDRDQVERVSDRVDLGEAARAREQRDLTVAEHLCRPPIRGAVERGWSAYDVKGGIGHTLTLAQRRSAADRSSSSARERSTGSGILPTTGGVCDRQPMRTAAALLLGAALAGCGGADSPSTPPERPASTKKADQVPIEQTTIAEGLEVPWGLTFLPDGDALYTERDSGRLLRLAPGDGQPEEIQVLPTRGNGEGGALGLAASPDFERDGLLYAYITTDADNRVVRFELGQEPQPILTGIPQNSFHDGGRIAFGPDGRLYVATGDAGDPDSAQDPDSPAGKILRVEPDGSVPRDNPIEDSAVYSLGHRNVEGLTWDEGGRLYASEFGENNFDEVNEIVAGANYGWPAFEGDGGREAEREGFVNPITTWRTSEASPSGAAVLRDGAVPQWEGDLFVAALRGERLWRLDLDRSGRIIGRESLLEAELGRIRNALAAPDGSLWVTTSNRDGRGLRRAGDDKIIRLGPAG